MMLYKEIEKKECPENFQRKDLITWLQTQPVSEDLRRQVGEIQSCYENLSLAKRPSVNKNKADESSSSQGASPKKLVDWSDWVPVMSQGPNMRDPSEKANRLKWAKALLECRDATRERLRSFESVHLRVFDA